MSHALSHLLHDPDFSEGRFWVRESFAPDEPILVEGRSNTRVYLVLSGTVVVHSQVRCNDGRTVRPVFTELSEQQVFGEMTLLGQTRCSASVSAVTACTMAAIDHYALLDFMDRNPVAGYGILKEMMDTLGDRLRHANHQVAALVAWGLTTSPEDEEDDDPQA